MRLKVDIAVAVTVPTVAEVLSAQGIPPEAAGAATYISLANEAITAYRTLASPAGIVDDITTPDFARVYVGDGRNEPVTPLDAIFPAADTLALFAVTIGGAITDQITRRFDDDDPAGATMLDAAASEGTERAAEYLEALYRGRLENEGRFNAGSGMMPFSPGYCGWHVSGQRKLFEYLKPEEISVHLNDSCLMQPLKSISGVLAAGPRQIFAFPDDFPFCDACRTHSCRARYLALLQADL